MNRRILGLLATLCLTSACKEEPVGAMTPIPRPADMPADAEKKAEAPKPARAPEPPPDPSKVVLRWKLDAPTAFRLTTTGASRAEPAPAPKKRGKKDKEPEAAPASTGATDAIFVLQKTETGDYAFHIVPQGQGEADQGTMSERGFVMDGLAGPLRNTAALVLELPRDPVGPDATWALGTDLVDLSGVPNFVEKKAERRNQVKLTSLTPGENGEQVATLEYDLSESLTGELRATRSQTRAAQAKLAEKKNGHSHDDGHGHEEEESSGTGDGKSALAEMRVKGRGEFLVKAGRWRSWEATLTTRTEGTTLPGAANGERTLRLTPLDSVPPDLLQPQAKK